MLDFTPVEAHSLRTLYGVERVPCDTQMREILDGVDLSSLRPAFKVVFAHQEATTIPALPEELLLRRPGVADIRFTILTHRCFSSATHRVY